MKLINIVSHVSPQYFQVLETYRKIVAAKQKRKPLSKGEREAAWKAVRDREILVKNLDALERKW